MDNLSIQLPLTPTLDAAAFNVVLKHMKTALGSFGKDIQMIDVKAVNADLAKVQKELSGINRDFQKAFDSGSVEEITERVEALLAKIRETGDETKKSSPMDAFAKSDALLKAGEFMGGFQEKTTETKEAMRQLAAQTGATGAELDALKTAAGNVFEGGGFASMGDAIKAIATAKQQLGDFLDPAGMEAFVSSAAAIGKTFDKDVNEVIGKSRTLIANFGLDGQEAGDLVAFAMREGGSGMDDVLDSMDEYSQLAKEAGFSAQEFVATLTNGVKAGARDTDKLADAMKETQIRLNAGDTSKALAEIASPISATIAGIVQAGEAGQLSVQEVMQKSAEAINTSFNAGEISESMRAQLQVAVSGTPAEDIGADLYGRIFAQKIDTAAITSQAAAAGQQIGDAMAPQGVFEKLELSAQRAFGDVAGLVGPAIGPMAQFATIAGQIGPAYETLKIGEKAAQFADFGKSILSSIAPMFGMAGATTAQGAATTATAGATNLLKIAMLALPFVAIAVGLGTVIGLVDAFTGSTAEAIEGLKKTGEEAKAAGESLSKTFADTKASDAQQRSIKSLADEYRRLENDTSVEGQRRFAEVFKELQEKAPGAIRGVQQYDAAHQPLAGTLRINADAAEKAANSQLKLNATMRQGEVAKAALAMEAMAEASADAKDQQSDLTEDMLDLQKVIDGVEGSVWVGEGLNLRTVSNAEEATEELREMEVEMADLQAAMVASEADAKGMIDQLAAGGMTTEEIAKGLGKSVDEVKRIQTGATEAETAFEATGQAVMGVVTQAVKGATATRGIGTAAKQSEVDVKRLADVYDKVKAAADDSYSGAFKGILGIKEKQRELQREIALTAAEEANYQKLVNENALNTVALLGLATAQAKLKIMEQQRDILAKAEVDEFAAAKAALAEMKRMELEAKKLQLALGEIDFSVTDFSDQARDILDQIKSIEDGIITSKMGDSAAKKVKEIQDALAAGIREIKKQKDAVNKAVNDAAADGDPTTTTKNSVQLLNALDALIAARRRAANEEIRLAQQEGQKDQIDDLKKFLDQIEALHNAALDRRIAQLEREIAREPIVDERSYERSLGKQLEIIEHQQEKEVSAILKGNDLYIRTQEAVQRARAGVLAAKTDADKAAAQTALEAAQAAADGFVQGLIEGNVVGIEELKKTDPILKQLADEQQALRNDLVKATTDEQRELLNDAIANYDQRLAGQELYLLGLIDQQKDTHLELLANEEKYDDQELTIREQSGAELYDIRAAQMEREIELERKGAERKAALVRAVIESSLAGFSKGFTSEIDKELNDSLALLEKAQEEELMSEEAFNNKKLALEEEAAKKREVIAQTEAGARLIIEAEAAEASLRQQEDLIQKKIALAESLGQTQIAAELGLELSTIQGDIAAQGSQLTSLIGGLSTELGEAVGSLGAGSAEQARAGFRDFFSVLAGGIQQFAAAKLTEVLLSLIGPTGIVGMIASFALKPFVSTLINSFVGPVVSGLLSFPTGGRFDSPTIAMIGDGSKLGGNDREWLFRDEHLRLLMNAVAGSSSAGVVARLESIEDLLSEWPTQLTAQGRDLKLVHGREGHAQQRRVRGYGAFRRAA